MAEEVIDAETGQWEELPAVAEPASHSTALVARDDISVAELVQQSGIIESAMREAMRKDVHYGLIPGVNKPTLLKPGAEKLLVLFRLAPSYESEKIWHEDGHLTVMTKCVLTHIPTGLVIAEGEGMCTTKESRYAWRKGERVCPECGEPQVREGKPRDGRPGNWYCWKKQGGCGATWDLSSEQGVIFKAMDTGRVANPDLPDSFNTVLKMSDKRALLAAVLNGTAASDVFTQDLDDRAARGDDTGSYNTGGYEDDMPTVATTPAPFNPATQLRKDAPTMKESWTGITHMLGEVDASIEWGPVIEQAIKGFYGQDFVLIDASAKIKAEAFRRTANAAGRLTELHAGNIFLTHENVRNAFAEMFEGTVVTVAEFEKDDEPLPLAGIEDATDE